MRVSLNQIKQFIDFELPAVDELVARINQQLGGVEEVIDLGKRYKDATIVKVVKCEKHPNADKLSVCEIDAGTGENVQVVCGAPNVREGLFVVWLPPKSVVPSTFDDKEPFVLEPKELRGVVSHGMLASARELGIGDSHDGIIEITDQDLHRGQSLKPGDKFAETAGLDDTIIDIENKMFTHRPDLFGQLGVAREIAGIQHKQFSSPEWYINTPEFKEAAGLELDVSNEAGENVPRFLAVAIKGVEVKPSPLWLQCALVAMGSKPINNIVDATNYIMLLTAQPTHAYDYDKLRGHKLGARMAKKGEKAELLNGKTYELDEDDIVIVDGEGIVGLGGIMGGGNSEVSAETKNIVLEVANFDMYAVRRSSMHHGLFTDALTRFNKGQSPLQNPIVISHLVKMIEKLAGGEQAGVVFDNQSQEVKDNEPAFVAVDFINERLGLALSQSEISDLLRNVEFDICEGCNQGDHAASVHYVAPFWRTDVELPEDIVEEVGRLYGFDKLPHELPKRSTKPAAKNKKREIEQVVRGKLAQAGANEILTYSFIHEKVMKNVGQNPTNAFRLSNALSPDLQFYRLSLTPSLLDKVHMNIKAGVDCFAIFELNKVHYKGEVDPREPEVPNEDSHVALVLAYGDKQSPTGASYYHARKYLGQIMNLKTHKFAPLADFDLSKDEWGEQLTAPYDPLRSSVILKDDQIWGVVGEFKQSVAQAFKLPDFTAGFEVHLDTLSVPESYYRPLSKYPSTSRDITVRVHGDITYEEILSTLNAVQGESIIERKIVPIDIYQAEGDDSKNVTLRITFTSREKTLQNDETNSLTKSLTDSLVAKLGATII